MKKICPYCGRSGEIGTSCAGCGYVLRETDKTVPEGAKSADDTAWEQKPDVTVQMDPAQAQLRHLDPETPNHTASRRTAKKTCIPAPVAIFAGVVITIYGVYGLFRTARFYGEGDPLNGIVGNAFSLAAAACGLMCFPAFRTRYGKYLKYALVIGLLISFGIPLVLIFL